MGRLVGGSQSGRDATSGNPILLRMSLLAGRSEHSKSDDHQPRSKERAKKQLQRRPFIVREAAASERSRQKSEELFDALLQQSTLG